MRRAPRGGSDVGGWWVSHARCAHPGSENRFCVELRIPDSPTRRNWDLALYALVPFTIFFFSFTAAFSSWLGFPSLAAGYAVDVAFCVDMVLCSRTFFYQYSGDLCTDPALCRKNYATGSRALTDLLGCIPLPIEVKNTATPLPSLLPEVERMG
jgi:hypothetical protein